MIVVEEVAQRATIRKRHRKVFDLKKYIIMILNDSRIKLRMKLCYFDAVLVAFFSTTNFALCST